VATGPGLLIETIDESKSLMNEKDVYRSAKLLIDQYGADAPVHAAMRADVMLARGDMDGAAVWRRIATAILAIQSTEGKTKH